MDPNNDPGQTWKPNRQNEDAYGYQNEPGSRSHNNLHPFYTPQLGFSEARERPPGNTAMPPAFPFHRPPNHFGFVPPAPKGVSPHGQLPPPFFNPSFRGTHQPPPSLHQFPPRPFLPPGHHIPRLVPPGPLLRPPVPNLPQGLDLLKVDLQISDDELERLRQVLTNVLDRCNQSDMALAKQWILKHCQPTRALGRLFHVLWGLRRPKKFETTLRALYLANDLLFHEKKHSSSWISPELVPHLAFLSNEASLLAGTPAQKDQLVKLVGLWETQKCLTAEQLSHIRNAMVSPQSKPSLPSLPALPPVIVPYYKVPAGFMVELCKGSKASYTPIPVRDASVVPMLPPNAASELESAVAEFYEGMDAALFKPNTQPPTISPLEWQPGFLDSWQADRRLSSRSRSCSRGRSYSRSPSRASYSSRSSCSPRRRPYSSQRSRSRSYSSRSRSSSPSKRACSRSSSRRSSPYSRSPDARRYA